MAGPCSGGLRSRVLAAVEAGESVAATARRFAAGRSTAHRRVAAARGEGRRDAKRMRGGPAPVARGEAAATVPGLAGGPSPLALAGIAVRLAEAHGVRVHLTTAHRALRRAGWTWKKPSLRAAEQEREHVAQARRAWWTDPDAVGGVSPERPAFLGERGALTTLSGLRGRSLRGTRACASALFGHWTRVAVLGALGAEGIAGATSVEAAASGAVFCACLERVLRPGRRRSKPDAVPVMGNLAARRAAQAGALPGRSGFARRCLPACSPDLDPVEPAWAKAEAELRRVAARTADALHAARGPALDAVTAQDAAGFFRRCGHIRPG